MKEDGGAFDLERKLLERARITEQQLLSAKSLAQKTAKPLWSALVRSGVLSQEEILAFFAQESGIALVDVADYDVASEVSASLPEAFCRSHQVMPLFRVKEVLYVACVNPLDSMLIDNIAKVTGGNVEPLLASTISVATAIDRYYGPQEESFAIANLLTARGNVQGIAYRRESERFPLNIPVILTLDDTAVALRHSSPLTGRTRNISLNGTAVNLQLFVFLPKGISVSVEFQSVKNAAAGRASIKAKGEIMYSSMEKDKKYLLGIRFQELTGDMRNNLLELVGLNSKDNP